VLTELKTRGLIDILIACVDGLKGFPDDTGSIKEMDDIDSSLETSTEPF